MGRKKEIEIRKAKKGVASKKKAKAKPKAQARKKGATGKFISLKVANKIGAMAKAIPKTQAKKKTKSSEDDDTGPRYTSRSKKRK